jgi:ADP-dependent NAD(P)H-hydrate dehydratase / NAD(P)H-hydrate epimerase
MKILTTQQIRLADQHTIEKEPISSIDLMERASLALFDALKRRIKKTDRIKIFCGMGNNGGDGLAVARMLIVSGYRVEVFKIIHSDKCSPDFMINEERLRKIKRASWVELHPSDSLPELHASDIVVDALFGSGLNRPLEGFPAKVIRHIDASGAIVYSVDMPSGLFGEDNSGNIPENIIKARFTFTFELPKLAFMFAENHQYTGNWQIVNIGLDKSFLEEAETPWYFLQPTDLVPGFRPRQKFDHKGVFGHALLIAGSYGKSGAAVLAARATLTCGAGLLTVHVPKNNYSIQQTSLPEAMVSVDEDEFYFSGIKKISGYSAIAIGPGMGKEPQTQDALKLLIQNGERPLIFDADALNILADNPTWLSFIPAGSILTPHVGEFDRLTGKSDSAWERLNKARDFAFRFKCYLILKGAHTAIVCPDRQVVFNSTGNPGMATGGSGDVLTGVILGFLAQGYTPFYSAIAGVYLHGLAADLATRKKPMECLLAGDIVGFLPKALTKVFYHQSSVS